MRSLLSSSLIAALLAVLACAACDKDPGSSKPTAGPSGSPPASPPATSSMPTPTPAPSAAAMTDGAPASPPAAAFTGTGVVEALGPSITMQGTHKLVDGGKTIVLLTSKKVDLKAHEGKRVKVVGPASTTVEGNQTIVDVQTIEDLP